MKIHIIGCSGSGKTYLANALSKKYNISHFDLDDIQWDNNAKEYGKKRTLDERKALLQEILYNNDEWIIEGVYYAWVHQCFDEADKIYVLDMPGYLYKSRIIMRSIKRKLGIQKGKRETLKSVYNLLKWTETFQNKNLKEIRSILDRYDDKVIWLSRKKDVEKIILSNLFLHQVHQFMRTMKKFHLLKVIGWITLFHLMQQQKRVENCYVIHIITYLI